MNKTIYMTYKNNIPNFVEERWLKNNKDYKVELSLDDDCISFLENNFNKDISNLFRRINLGMNKADLWRLCKLYVNSGVYADVDLVPYLDIDSLDKNITFYSCIANNNISIFQAIMICFYEKKNHPLFLIFLLSFIINKPYNSNHKSKPTYDMYDCIKYMLDVEKILPEIKYEIDILKLKINIGSSIKNIKTINLNYFPKNIENFYIKLHKNSHNNTFNFEILDNKLIVKRLDKNTGWGYNHNIDICFNHKTSFYFFKESLPKWVNCNTPFWLKEYLFFVENNNIKILDSRDDMYINNNSSW